MGVPKIRGPTTNPNNCERIIRTPTYKTPNLQKLHFVRYYDNSCYIVSSSRTLRAHDSPAMMWHSAGHAAPLHARSYCSRSASSASSPRVASTRVRCGWMSISPSRSATPRNICQCVRKHSLVGSRGEASFLVLSP